MDLKARIGLLVEAQGARRAARDIDGVARPVRRLGQESETACRRMRTAEAQALSFRKGLIGMTSFVSAGAVGVFGLGAVLHGAAEEYRKAYKATAATNTAIAATGGVAGVSAGHVEDLADRLSLKVGVDDNAIHSAENLLLTFRNVHNEVGRGNDIFDQATKTALDMSAAYGQDLRSSAIQLGKALEDPVKGAQALRRVGAIDQHDIDTVKAMAQAHRSLGDQQRYVLDAINKAGVRGQAAAQADPIDRMNVAVKLLEKSLGRDLAPAVTVVADEFATFVTGLEQGTGVGGQVADTAKDIWNVVKALSPALIGLTAAFVAYKTVLIATAAYERLVAAVEFVQTFMAAAAATDVMTASMVALDVSMDANPIGLVIAALVALGVGFYVAYKRVAWFRHGVQSVWGWNPGSLAAPDRGPDRAGRRRRSLHRGALEPRRLLHQGPASPDRPCGFGHVGRGQGRVPLLDRLDHPRLERPPLPDAVGQHAHPRRRARRRLRPRAAADPAPGGRRARGWARDVDLRRARPGAERG